LGPAKAASMTVNLDSFVSGAQRSVANFKSEPG
jgi:hypothetical protein